MRRAGLVSSRLTRIYVPQTEPVLQLELPLLLNENELPPEILEAKLEICLVIFWLWQAGQLTSLVRLALSTSASNGLPHSAHMNSYKGITHSMLGITSSALGGIKHTGALVLSSILLDAGHLERLHNGSAPSGAH